MLLSTGRSALFDTFVKAATDVGYSYTPGITCCVFTPTTTTIFSYIHTNRAVCFFYCFLLFDRHCLFLDLNGYRQEGFGPMDQVLMLKFKFKFKFKFTDDVSLCFNTNFTLCSMICVAATSSLDI